MPYAMGVMGTALMDEYFQRRPKTLGDTILAGGIGRQMPETDLRRQMMSIGTKLLRLPPSTALYPGHGPATSLEREIAQNPIFRGAGVR